MTLMSAAQGGERADPAASWHPGERVVTETAAGGSRAIWRPMLPEGRALEARHGDVPWLHAANRVARFDARWFVEHGHRPVAPAGSAVAP